MTILCGTDFSAPAAQAADAAATLAAISGETLLLAHVAAGAAAAGTEAADPVLASARDLLRREANRLRKRGANVREELLTGTPDEALVELVRRAGVQLVVLASLGQRPASRWLLGSVSERTAQNSPVPTLVVRPAARPLAERLKRRKLKVVVGVDFTAAADAALEWLGTLQAHVRCQIVVVYLSWPAEEAERLGLPRSIALEKTPPEARAILERDLAERVARVGGLKDVSTRVEAGLGRPDARLIEMASEEGADLLVVGAHQRQGLDRVWSGSVSRSVLHNAPMSVVSAPVHDAATLTLSIPNIGRVLAATDFSALGNFATLHACSLLPAGGVVRMVHVVHPRALGGGAYDQALAAGRRHADFARECRRKLLALSPASARERGIKIEVEVAESTDTARAICQAARRFGADVICIGSKGHQGLVDALLGSVAVAVMRQTTRPLLVIRPPRQ
jgi:nucleotide-binding universal stress UspA family protein